jgi:hypothetical protein
MMPIGLFSSWARPAARAERRELLRLAGHALQADALGDVLDQQHCSCGGGALADETAADVPGNALAAKRLVRDPVQLELVDVAAQQLAQGLGHRFLLEVGVDVEERAPHQIVTRHTAPLLHGPVPRDDPAVAVEGDEPLAQALHHAPNVPLPVDRFGGQRCHVRPLAQLEVGEDPDADRRAQQHHDADRRVGDVDTLDGRPDHDEIGGRGYHRHRDAALDAIVVRLERRDQRERQVQRAPRTADEVNQAQRENLIDHEDPEIEPQRRGRLPPQRGLDDGAVGEKPRHGQDEGGRALLGRGLRHPGDGNQERERPQQR